jgi:hypothetical protein
VAVYEVRNCDWIGLVAINGFWWLNIALLWMTFRKVDKSTALWRTLALGFGLPTASQLERGNIIIICMTCVILGFGPLLKSARWRWFFVGMAVNLKIYLLAGIFSQLLRRRWLWFEAAWVSVILIYGVTYIIYGAGTPLELMNNLPTTGELGNFSLTDLWFSASYNGFLSALQNSYLVVAGSIGSHNVDILLVVIPLLMKSGELAVVLAAAAAWYRPESVPMGRLTALAFGFVMIVTEPEGYAEPFLFFFVMQERWTGFWKGLALVCSYILLVPLDIPIDQVSRGAVDSYLAGHTVFVTYYVAVGHFVRPALVILTVFSLSMQTIVDVWGDIRNQGWAGRWRYRHDAFRLPGVMAPRRRLAGAQPPAEPHTEAL